MDNTPDDLAVYIHWPYCTRICPYCDFNVYKAKQDDDLVEAILKDLSHWRSLSGPRRITSIHFGGGTPSLLNPAHITRLINRISGLWGLSKDVEIAIEANPNDYDKNRWRDMASAGVNRLSLGIQTFHNPALKLLGRDHDAKTAAQTLEAAVSLFPSVSLDLIFGWAGQTTAQWENDIKTALDHGPSHISAYQLTIEPGTAFARMEARGASKSTSETESADFFDIAARTFVNGGYEHYEVSNFARKGHRSRHNMTYWQGGDYVGAGPGAHGRLTRGGLRSATIAAMKPEDYKASINRTGTGIRENGTLSPVEWAEEYVLMGLRINDGISMKRFEQISGTSLKKDRVAAFLGDKYLALTGDTLSATPKGRLVLNHITEKLLVG